jgi:hypothetical protein
MRVCVRAGSQELREDRAGANVLGSATHTDAQINPKDVRVGGGCIFKQSQR